MVDQEKFDSGYRWQAYLKTFTDIKKREEWQNGILEVRFSDNDLLQCCGGPTRVLVISEDWCGDCREVIPILIKLSILCPKIDLRIFPRDRNKDLMKFYSWDGKERIPTVVFFDRDFKEIGRWIERPKGYIPWMEQWLKNEKQGRTMAGLDKWEKQHFKVAKKIIYRIKFRREVIDEWQEILVKNPQ